MKKSFWDNLEKPFFALAPMADVTDAAFRFIIAKYGKPEVMFTQFVSCDGLCSAGKKALLIDLKYEETERPIVAQFFGAKPDNFYQCARLAVKLGFDGIDINMGCPDKSVMKQCAGAALIKVPKLAAEIIIATKKGAGDLPISIKTRTGDTKDNLKEWLPILLEQKPAAITVHARTRKEMSNVPAKWHLVKQAVAMAKGSGTLIIGNGDVKDLAEARQKAKETGCDGVMLGRAIFGNPWLFAHLPERRVGAGFLPSLSQRLNVLVEHTKLFEKLLMQPAKGRSQSEADAPLEHASGGKNFAIMKKHFKAYVSGFDGAKGLMIKLMATKNAKEVEEIIKEFLKTPKFPP